MVHLTKEHLITIREVYRLTRLELSKHLGISQPLITLIEKGKRNITNDIVERYIEAFDLDEQKLMEIMEVRKKYTVKIGN